MKKNPKSNKRVKKYRFRLKSGNPTIEKKILKKEFPKGELGNEENDIDLMMIFGLDGEAKKRNPEHYREVKKNLDSQRKIKGAQEYVVESQNGEFEKKYREMRKKSGGKILPTAIFLVISFVLELFVFYNEGLFERLTILYHNSIPPLAALQILLLICAFNYKSYIKGMGLITGRASSASVFTVSSTVMCIYYIFLAVMGAVGIEEGTAMYNLYLTPTSLLALYTAVADYADTTRKYNAFLGVSEKGEKHVLTVKKLSEGHVGRYSPDGKNMITVEKARFVKDFVKRSNSEYKEGRHSRRMILLSLLVALGMGIYKVFAGAELVSAASACIMTMMLTMPFSILFSYSFIFGGGASVASASGCTIVGNGAFEDYSESTAVYFDDTAVFPPSKIKLKGFRAYGENRIDTLLYIINAIYKKIGSPAAAIFEKSVGDYDEKFDIDILDVSSSGIRGAVNGGTVFVGGIGYMRDCGFEHEDFAHDEKIDPGISVVYLALGHSIALKAYLEYTMESDIPKIASLLKRQGMYLGICTCDPSINDEMMNVRIPLEKYPIGIMKSIEGKDSDKCKKEISGGIVSSKGEESLLSGLIVAVKASSIFRTDMIIKGFVFATGVILSAVFAIFGKDGGVGMWYMLFYQLISALPTLFLLSGLSDRV
ncbi:MAG: hypothetical protein E7675_01685 [Ruminococcaceae bacterium]|nr:hypothetical protein [Oscillospiraceae bacterium]